MKFAHGIRHCFRSEEFHPAPNQVFPVVFLVGLFIAEGLMFLMGEPSLRTGLIFIPAGVAGVTLLGVWPLCWTSGYEINEEGIRIFSLRSEGLFIPWRSVDTTEFRVIFGMPFLCVACHEGTSRRTMWLPAFVPRIERLAELLTIHGDRSEETAASYHRAA